jgi:hypothetical protein
LIDVITDGVASVFVAFRAASDPRRAAPARSMSERAPPRSRLF